jgi:putative heme-binding domain-containing protein
VLKSPSVAAKLSALPVGALKTRVETLASTAPARDAQVEQAIATRIAEFRQNTSPLHPDKGLALFTTNCSICHKIGTLGNIVGPHLDGIGNRGLERLCEDILDPSREVDPAFHLQIFTLKDQSIRSGLIRRREGGSIVLADAAGQESRLEAAEVGKQEASPFSLMPASFHASLPADDFRELLGWLLRK